MPVWAWRFKSSRGHQEGHSEGATDQVAPSTHYWAFTGLMPARALDDTGIDHRISHRSVGALRLTTHQPTLTMPSVSAMRGSGRSRLGSPTDRGPGSLGHLRPDTL